VHSPRLTQNIRDGFGTNDVAKIVDSSLVSPRPGSWRQIDLHRLPAEAILSTWQRFVFLRSIYDVSRSPDISRITCTFPPFNF